MATKPIKPRGGSCCAVATCTNYASKVKLDGKRVSFYRFPKDPECQKKWTLKCRRSNKINPGLSYMCSEHFCEDAYVRDLKAELLGYTTKSRKLKADAMPTLNLPEDHTYTSVASTSATNRRSRMESKIKKRNHADLITSIMNSDAWSCNVSSSTVMVDEDSASSTKPDYEKLYNELLKKHEVLKNESNSQKHELLSIKQSSVDYQNINESQMFKTSTTNEF